MVVQRQRNGSSLWRFVEEHIGERINTAAKSIDIFIREYRYTSLVYHIQY